MPGRDAWHQEGGRLFLNMEAHFPGRPWPRLAAQLDNSQRVWPQWGFQARGPGRCPLWAREGP